VHGARSLNRALKSSQAGKRGSRCRVGKHSAASLAGKTRKRKSWRNISEKEPRLLPREQIRPNSQFSPIHPSRHARAILLYPPAARFLLADCLPLRFHALASDVMFPSKRSFRRRVRSRGASGESKLVSFPRAKFRRVSTALRRIRVYALAVAIETHRALCTST